MLTEIPPLRPRRGARKARRVAPTQPPGPAAPVLVSAAFVIDDSAILTLGFDRAVSIAGIAPGAFTVAHHPSTQAFVGDTSELLDATTVRVVLVYDDACDPGETVIMNAGGGNGIVAVDGGIAWAGAGDLELPFA